MGLGIHVHGSYMVWETKNFALLLATPQRFKVLGPFLHITLGSHVTYKFHFPRACHELLFALLLGHHLFESMIFLVCIFLVVITFGSTYLTHLVF
jgi:hypothetical protein